MDSANLRQLRTLAAGGSLAATVRTAAPARRAALVGAAYELAWPIVYARLTRPAERRRGHWRCASGLTQLAAECSDRFHDDLEAVVDDLVCHTRAPVRELEAWVGARLRTASVNGHRHRRGARGALQRPRVPRWLSAALDDDPWLLELALHVLEWAGVPDTAGSEVWPIGSWVARRSQVLQEPVRTATVRADLDRVLDAMRRRPLWYASYVERPLGAKPAPVAPPPADGVDGARPWSGSPDDAADRRLTSLATEALEAIGAGLNRGHDPDETVVRVLTAVFGSGSGSEEIDRLLAARLSDPRVVEQVVALARDAAGPSD